MDLSFLFSSKVKYGLLTLFGISLSIWAIVRLFLAFKPELESFDNLKELNKIEKEKFKNYQKKEKEINKISDTEERLEKKLELYDSSRENRFKDNDHI